MNRRIALVPFAAMTWLGLVGIGGVARAVVLGRNGRIREPRPAVGLATARALVAQAARHIRTEVTSESAK
jgi:hypothetical protein